MVEIAKENMMIEEAKNGLIIIKGVYYPKDDINKESNEVQDVTIPLQFITKVKINVHSIEFSTRVSITKISY